MSADLFIWGLVAHLVADWLLQNEWMAVNKVRLGHPAGIVHAGLHGIAAALVFGPVAGAVLAFVHYVIDLRFLLTAWGRLIGQTSEGPLGIHVALWRDQVVHIVCLAVAAAVVA